MSPPEFEGPSFSKAEKFLMVLAAALFLATGYVYVADISLKRLFFPSAEDRLLSTPIGTATAMTGTALRQGATDSEFRSLSVGAKLFPNDTLMTGPASTLRIELNDGQKMDLAPNSLVKLSFGSDFALAGVVKLKIEVLQGSGEGVEKKEPEATERSVPLAVFNPLPAQGSILSFTPSEVARRRKPVDFAFTLNHKTAQPLTLRVFLRGPDVPRRELTALSLAPAGTEVTASLGFTAPGTYEWEVQNTAGLSLSRSGFEISRKAGSITLLPILNSSNRLEGTATKKSFDGFVIRWEPVEGPGLYVVRVFKPGTDQVVLRKELQSTELTLNRNNLLIGALQYSVDKDMGGGFLASSGRHTFGFEFLPPELTAPPPDAVMDYSSLIDTNFLVFFTWSKTNYTTAYEFELASDPQFSKLLIHKKTKDNFQSIASPSSGRFYWRVRSLANGLWSNFSEVRSLAISQ